MTRPSVTASVVLIIVLTCATACGGGDATEPATTPAPAQSAPSAGEGPAGQPPGDTTTDPQPADDAAASAEPTVTPLRHRNVEIYFPSAVSDGLVAEIREIFDTGAPGDRVKQIINDLVSGPNSSKALRSLPSHVRLRQVYVLDNGVAYLDFSAELRQGLGGGSESELLTVYSIVNSVVLNVPEVTRVGILLNGRQLDTLDGHVDIRRPLPAAPKLIRGSIVTQAPQSRPEGRPLSAQLGEPQGDR